MIFLVRKVPSSETSTDITGSIKATPSHCRDEYVARRKNPRVDGMRKLRVTPAAPEFHVDPVIHQNTAAVSRGARLQPLRLAQCSAAGTRRGRGFQTWGSKNPNEKNGFLLTQLCRQVGPLPTWRVYTYMRRSPACQSRRAPQLFLRFMNYLGLGEAVMIQ